MPWILLVLAVAAETVGTTALKASEGFTRMGPSLIVPVAYGVSFFLLAQVLRTSATRQQHEGFPGVVDTQLATPQQIIADKAVYIAPRAGLEAPQVDARSPKIAPAAIGEGEATYAVIVQDDGAARRKSFAAVGIVATVASVDEQSGRTGIEDKVPYPTIERGPYENEVARQIERAGRRG